MIIRFECAMYGDGIIEGIEVLLWGECYNVEETSLNFLIVDLKEKYHQRLKLTNLKTLSLPYNELSGEIHRDRKSN